LQAAGEWELIGFDDVRPGDVIIHHPNTVHGSGGNTSAGTRRLAASSATSGPTHAGR